MVQKKPTLWVGLSKYCLRNAFKLLLQYDFSNCYLIALGIQ